MTLQTNETTIRKIGESKWLLILKIGENQATIEFTNLDELWRKVGEIIKS